MGEHFYSVVLPRMKKVLAYDKSGISKDDDVKEKYNENNAGGFFKYYDLEQFEQTLDKTVYTSTLLDSKDIYNQYIFFKDKKLLERVELDYKEGKIKVDFSKLYNNVDISETLSNLLGMMIDKITDNKIALSMETKRGKETIDINPLNLDWKLVRSLLLW